MKGWVKLHRKIYDHWLFQEKRTFSKFEAWVDLMMMVNHADNKILMDGTVHDVERGSVITSVRKLCDRWDWSNTKVRKFLELLKSEGMLNVESDSKKTLITLINYGKFQGSDDEETTPKPHENDAETPQKHTNKNGNNVEEGKDSCPKQVYDEDSTFMRMAKYFLRKIREWKPDFVMRGSMQKWADDFRKMHELDNRSKEDIQRVIDFVTKDSFEQANVMSPDKMRKRFDQLDAKSKQVRIAQPQQQERRSTVPGIEETLSQLGVNRGD